IIEWLHDKEKYALTRSNPVYRHLDTLTKNTVVLQTNLDKSLERHCNFTTYLNINLPANLPASCLIYLHGEITNPSSWILTRDEYDDFYQRQKTPGFVSFIENIFKQKDVLFLGYSLNDKEILDQIAKVKGSGRKYVLVLGEMELEKVRNQIWEQNLKHHEINVVRYDIEKEGYDAFSAFLGSITSLIRPPVQVASADEEGDSLYAQ
ncbi:MAG: SIR2 family protein, partial [Candidatus Pacebacteria bacterium]|nr:SIR2 family protein [Candidatus Paceibacterota bacterium]